MTQEPIRVNLVPCPCCGAELFSAVQMTNEAGQDIWGLKKGAPHLEHDVTGPYMVCQGCHKRVNLEGVPGTVATFKLADHQPCIAAGN